MTRQRPTPSNSIPRIAEGLLLPIAALIGGAAVVVAGLTVSVAVPDDVVLDGCVVVCWCDDVKVLLDSAAEEDGDEDCMSDDDVGEKVEVMMVVKVDDIVEVADSVVVGFVDEDAVKDAGMEDAETETTPVDSEIKLPPLDNNVTVCSPLTTTVGAVTVVCGTPLLCKVPELVAETLPLPTDPIVLVVVKSNEYVVLGSKLDGNVAKADESTESALAVCDCCSVAVAVAGHPAMF